MMRRQPIAPSIHAVAAMVALAAGAGGAWAAPAAVAASDIAAIPAQHYRGIAYGAEDGRERYRESHWVFQADGHETRLVLYQCPDGAPFARKWVRGRVDDPAPNFDLIDQRDGYREGVRGSGSQREVYVQKGEGKPMESAPLPTPADLVIDAGFDAYVRSHWRQLEQSGGRAVPFLVPSRLAAFELKVDAQDRVMDGTPVYRIRMRLDAWYGFATPTILVSYAEADRRLWRFEGISNLRNHTGGTQNVRLDFPPAERDAPPSRQDMDAAAAMPLVSRCDD
ncbi:hypothetical protein [Achromobacter pestifer]|uniref:DUF3108 domain-containing protein n=1 Tax=Achromobacter pestifer TaxID=1353889 RepID=A0A6S6Z0Y2_9BURK|nr:hypothetical protein [Achromobacter pestifer]CAB3642674.1 hypothetical protein LMG3431_02250 [Achromobacter pestifer]